MNTALVNITGAHNPARSDLVAALLRETAALGAEFGADVHRRMKDLYRPVLERQLSRDGVAVTQEVAYGPDGRHRLDVYHSGGSARPMLVFLPGGGFIGGDKVDDDMFYGNLGTYFARAGVSCVVANYRLAPAHVWPAGIEDAAAVVAWVRANAPTYGGDPGRIFLSGHSSGAVHAAGFLFDRRFHPQGGAGVRGGILMSGGYAVTADGMRAGRRAYFGADDKDYPDRSPLNHVGESAVPLLIVAAEYDPPAMIAPAFELAQAVTRRDAKSPWFSWLKGHNHISYLYSLGTEQAEFGEGVLEFIHAH